VGTSNFALESYGGGIFHQDSANTTISSSCIDLNNAVLGGGIYRQGDLGTLLATNNYWGNRFGHTLNNIANQGDDGDTVNFSVAGHFDTPPNITLPQGLNVPDCFSLPDEFVDRPEVSNSTDANGIPIINDLGENLIGTWGQSGLALEVYIRTSDILGYQIPLTEVFGATLHNAAEVSQFPTEDNWLMFTEVLGRTYYEYAKNPRQEGSPVCPSIYNTIQVQYVIENSRQGLLCTLGTVSEWYGEIIAAEYQAYLVANFIRTGQINQIPIGLTRNWLQRGHLIISSESLADRTWLGTIQDCYNWEEGQPSRASRDGVPGNTRCLWSWGNWSVTSRNVQARTRITNSANSVDSNETPRDHIYTSPSMPTIPESNILFRFALYDAGGYAGTFDFDRNSDEFFLLTWNQYTVLRCKNALTPVESGGSWFPACR